MWPGSDNLDMVLKAQATKGKLGKLGFTKLDICASKDTIKNTKKNNPQNSSKYLPVTYLIRNMYSLEWGTPKYSTKTKPN